MPPLARTVGLALVLVSPSCLDAQIPACQSSACAARQVPVAASPSGDMSRPTFATPGTLHYLPQAPLDAVIPASFESTGSQPVAGRSVPLSPPSGKTPLPLTPPGQPKSKEAGPLGGLSSAVTIVGSLGVVLGVFLLVVWGIRRAAPPGLTLLPREVFEVLGRAPLGGRQQVHLVRCGQKLILVSVTPAGAETLTEVTDPLEVDRLAGYCQQARPDSATAVFRQVFGQFAPRRPRPVSVGDSLEDYDA